MRVFGSLFNFQGDKLKMLIHIFAETFQQTFFFVVPGNSVHPLGVRIFRWILSFQGDLIPLKSDPMDMEYHSFTKANNHNLDL